MVDQSSFTTDRLRLQISLWNQKGFAASGIALYSCPSCYREITITNLTIEISKRFVPNISLCIAVRLFDGGSVVVYHTGTATTDVTVITTAIAVIISRS